MVRRLGGRQVTDAELLGRLLAGVCEVDERLLEALLAEGVPAPAALRRAVRGRWNVGAALLLGGALALGSAGPAAAQGGAAPAVAVAAPVAAPPAAVAEAPVAAVELAPAALGELALVEGTALVLPALEVNAAGVAAPAQQTPGTYYVVRAGDTLSAIAQAAYGNAGLWRLIYESNLAAIANANLIYPGQQLYIPPSGQQVPVGVTPGGMTPGSQTGQSGQYIVVAGDNLSSIAQRAYGNGALWWVIYDANRGVIANPSLIYPGQQISIPPYGTTGQSGGGQSGGGQTGQGQGQYTVRPGDSLWSIAQFAYGNPLRWQDIYNRNAAAIGPNPGVIFSGTVLNMP